MDRSAQYAQSAAYIAKKMRTSPKIAVVLGSGLGDYAQNLTDSVQIPYREIPHFPVTRNENHRGIMHIGKINGVSVLLMSGRFHYYEGHSFADTAYPIGVFKKLGVETVIITNAAGGINPAFSTGDLMLITDHIKFSALSPVTGFEGESLGPRFFDMSDAYTASLREQVKLCGKKLGIRLHEGIYAYMGGPQFETPAEIRMLATLGADAVGMSTVPEVIMAAYCKIKVVGISCISNLAAGLNPVPLSDEDVRDIASKVSGTFCRLVDEIISEIG